MITAKGHNGLVTFDGDFITIDRKGGLARMTVGKGQKRIPITSVTAVQWKPPGGVVNGFIQFTIGGGNESRSKFGRQTIDAANDENSVIVTKKHADEFVALRAAVEEAIVNRGQPQVIHATAPASKLDQLKQLGELRDSGVLSQEEFEAEKAAIMSGDAPSPGSSADSPSVPESVAAAEDIGPVSDGDDRKTGKGLRIAGAMATGGLSEVGRFALKKRRDS